MRRLLALVLILALAVFAVRAVGHLWRQSLPQLEGERALSGLVAPVDVQRDALGTVTVIAADPLDAARALGFVHAQDRFFAMDLARRRASGRLAELVGERALVLDRAVLRHDLETVADTVLGRAPDRHRARLEAYASGVNAGLEALARAPFEYSLLGAEPEPWTAAHSVLVALSIFLDLHDENGDGDREREALRAAVGDQLYAFLAPRGSEWDAALTGPAVAPPGPPAATLLDLRQRDSAPLIDAAAHENPIGSNAFAVGGGQSAIGAAVVANDMHLGLRVPPAWYRARLRYRSDDGLSVDAVGISLPGAPSLIAGSNGYLAWGFTNSYADVTDLVEIELDGAGGYRSATGWQPLTQRSYMRRLGNGSEIEITIDHSEYGPLLDHPAEARKALAVRWIAHDPAAIDLSALDFAEIRNLRRFIDLCKSAGLPQQNLVAGDRAGNVVWTVCGKLPKRVGHSGEFPQPPESAGWNGYRPASDNPEIYNPTPRRVYNGNNRSADLVQQAWLSMADYPLGARGQQLRLRLQALGKASAADLHAIQVDDEARFLVRWQQLLLGTLRDQTLAVHPELSYLARLARAERPFSASVESRTYAIVERFRREVQKRVWSPFAAMVRAQTKGAAALIPNQFEAPLWQLLTSQPLHLLDRRYASWDALLIEAAQATREALLAEHGALSQAYWGQSNRTRIHHPMSAALPLLAPWIDYPSQPQAGGAFMPRVQRASFGASMRMVMTPGRDQLGILTLPGGQSGHPLSRYYRVGLDAHIAGEPLPLLPGPAVHTLVFLPEQ